MHPGVSLESLSPGKYAFGDAVHMIGVCIGDDHRVEEMHDNLMGSARQFRPRMYSSAYKLCMTSSPCNEAKQERREVVGKLVSFPWSVHKLLGQANENAQKRLEGMSSGPYRLSDIETTLQGTGVTLVQQDHLQEQLPPGRYIFGRKGGHVVGLCVREHEPLEVHDNKAPGGVGHFSTA